MGVDLEAGRQRNGFPLVSPEVIHTHKIEGLRHISVL